MSCPRKRDSTNHGCAYPEPTAQCDGMPSNFRIELRSSTHACRERTNICLRGTSSLRWRSDPTPHVVDFRLIPGRCRIKRRTAPGAESLQADAPAIGRLAIFSRLAGEEHERAWTRNNDGPQRSAAHRLAVRAVANGGRFGIGFGLERHVSAVTASIDFHISKSLRPGS
jgi:hypothetical protein